MTQVQTLSLFPANRDTLINPNHITSLTLVQSAEGERLQFTVDGMDGIAEPIVSRPFAHFSIAYRWLTRFLQGYLSQEAMQEVLDESSESSSADV